MIYQNMVLEVKANYSASGEYETKGIVMSMFRVRFYI